MTLDSMPSVPSAEREDECWKPHWCSNQSLTSAISQHQTISRKVGRFELIRHFVGKSQPQCRWCFCQLVQGDTGRGVISARLVVIASTLLWWAAGPDSASSSGWPAVKTDHQAVVSLSLSVCSIECCSLSFPLAT